MKPTPQAQRRVAGVKTCFGPGPTPAVWHRPGPAPGSSSEARPQARPRQKNFSLKRFLAVFFFSFFSFFSFFTPLTRRSVARGDADPWRPSGPTRLAPGTVEGFPLHRPGARRKPPGGWIGSGTRSPPSPPPESPTFGRPSPAGSSPRPVNFTARGETGHPPRPSPVAGWTSRGIEHGPRASPPAGSCPQSPLRPPP